MKNISVYLILLALLFVVGPVIQKKLGLLQKESVNATIFDADQASEDKEMKEFDNKIYASLKTVLNHKSIYIFIKKTLFMQFSLPENIILPPPKS